jgi:hypothetical protein
MAIDLYRYGTQSPIYFKVTLNGVGVTGLTFAADDIKLYQDGVFTLNIGTACNNEVAGGIYYWSPGAVGHTQCEVMQINIIQVTGSTFDENCLIIATGGDASARFDAT